nr:glycoside hydrolase family 25 protein [Rhodococcus sp. (in: high G+C Gram-positive bacteria)]
MSFLKRSSLLRTAASVVLATALACALPAAASADPHGPDVSSWQHIDGTKIDWHAVRESGHDFAMVKATEGLNYVNPFFVQDSLVMRVAGVARGAYHYADVRLSPEAQGAYYSTVVLGINGQGDLPPVLDLEDSRGLPPAQVIDWTHRYLNTVQALTGRQPIIYTYPNFWRTAMADTHEFSQYPLWIADYNDSLGPLPGGWSHWMFWQFTDNGRIPGIAAPTDVNNYSGSGGDIRKLARW